MHAYKTAAKIEEDGEIRLSELPFRAGEEVDVIILLRDAGESRTETPESFREQLPPVTRRLLGVARGVSESDYNRYLEEKYR
ncbi:MAG TPA: hypothetical protein VKK31_01130 [Thermoanaerobaculia bacterium]|nr:hypothetical protein [Thermoanaerobaculia bacterium]